MRILRRSHSPGALLLQKSEQSALLRLAEKEGQCAWECFSRSHSR